MSDGKIYSPECFANNPSYRAYKQGRQKMIWDFLAPAWRWGINPTDVDALVERNGHYLLFECKASSVDKIPTGQARMLRDLNERHGFTVFVVTGFTEVDICELTIVWPRRARCETHKNIDSALLLEKCKQWFNWVDYASRPEPIMVSQAEQTFCEWVDAYELTEGRKQALR